LRSETEIISECEARGDISVSLRKAVVYQYFYSEHYAVGIATELRIEICPLSVEFCSYFYGFPTVAFMPFNLL
jgi:hypothetical protein